MDVGGGLLVVVQSGVLGKAGGERTVLYLVLKYVLKRQNIQSFKKDGIYIQHTLTI